MADSVVTIADLLTVNSRDLKDGDFRGIFDETPILAAIAAVNSTNGDLHKYSRLTTAPTVGVITGTTGRDFSKAVYTAISETLKAVDGSFAIPKHIADAYVKGPEAYIQLQLIAHLRAWFVAFEKQIVQGTSLADSASFSGLPNFTALDALADATVINAGGSTATVQSSAYLVRFNDTDGIAPVVSTNIEVGATNVQNILGISGGNIPMYYTPMVSYQGLQQGSALAAVRICNINEATDSKPLTDALISKASEAFPSGRGPTHLIAHPKVIGGLRRSRVQTNVPYQIKAMEWDNMPIIESRNFSLIEPVVS